MTKNNDLKKLGEYLDKSQEAAEALADLFGNNPPQKGLIKEQTEPGTQDAIQAEITLYNDLYRGIMTARDALHKPIAHDKELTVDDVVDVLAGRYKTAMDALEAASKAIKDGKFKHVDPYLLEATGGILETTISFNAPRIYWAKLDPVKSALLKPDENGRRLIDDVIDGKDILPQMRAIIDSLDELLPANAPAGSLSATITRAEVAEYPVDKINNNVWRLMELEKDPDGQLHFDTASRSDKKKGIVLDTVFSIDFASLDDDASLTITRKLTPFDKRIYVACGALYNAGNRVVTVTQIYYAAGYEGTPSADVRERINDSLTKMLAARIYINNDQEAAYYNYNRFPYDGSLLPFERRSAVINGKLTDAAVHFFREPPLISFAKEHGNEITTIKVKMLQSPISKTDTNLAVEDYLIERIATERRKGKKSVTILYDTISGKLGITGKTQADKKNRQRLPDRVLKYLKYYQECGWIAAFTERPDGVKVTLPEATEGQKN